MVIYGRRRVGKTYLVKEFFNSSFSFYATGVPSKDRKTQLKAFHQALKEYKDITKTAPKDWFEAFSRLKTILLSNDVYREGRTGKKLVLR